MLFRSAALYSFDLIESPLGLELEPIVRLACRVTGAGAAVINLIDRNRQFLTGEPGSPRIRQALVRTLSGFPEVAEVRFLRPEFIGPKRLFVIASVDLVGDDVESTVARKLRELEYRLEEEPYVAEAVLTVSEPDDGGRTRR